MVRVTPPGVGGLGAEAVAMVRVSCPEMGALPALIHALIHAHFFSTQPPADSARRSRRRLPLFPGEKIPPPPIDPGRSPEPRPLGGCLGRPVELAPTSPRSPQPTPTTHSPHPRPHPRPHLLPTPTAHAHTHSHAHAHAHTHSPRPQPIGRVLFIRL